jgi:hypothetical protein
LVSGTAPPGGTWNTSHIPSVGYFAYLITGRRYFLDEVQFVASYDSMSDPATVRENGAGIMKSNSAGSVRHAAWLWRTLVQSIAVTPDSDTVYLAELRTLLVNSVNYYHATYIAQSNNPFGWVEPYEPAGAYGSTGWFGATWMQDFLTAAWGYSKDLGLGLDATATAKLNALFAWKAGGIVGRLGATGPAEFLYRDYAPYAISLSPSPAADWASGTGPWHSTWAATYTATYDGSNPDTTSSGAPYSNPGPDVEGDVRSYLDATHPSANALPAIAYAVKHGITGAQAAYQRLTTASNWSQMQTGLDAEPVWAVAPSSPIS